MSVMTGQNPTFEEGMSRHSRSLKYALSVLGDEFREYVEEIYLYGSFARGEQRYHSDIDLLIKVKEDTTPRIMRLMRTKVIPDDFTLPEVELKFFTGKVFSSSYRFNENLRRDGKLLWKKN